jgi:hypothetical protein
MQRGLALSALSRSALSTASRASGLALGLKSHLEKLYAFHSGERLFCVPLFPCVESRCCAHTFSVCVCVCLHIERDREVYRIT